MFIGTPKADLWMVGTLLTVALFCLTTGQAAPNEPQNDCNESKVILLAEQCRRASELKDLDGFYNFFENFDHLTNRCLRPQSASGEPSRSSQMAEDECKHQNLLFHQVRQLARLVERWHSNKPVCTIEFAMQVLHFHDQIEPMEIQQNFVLSRMLRLLANSVSWQCRFTLVKRLRKVEKGAPDSQLHIKLVLGFINRGEVDKLMSMMQPLERVDRFVPILEHELSEQMAIHSDSIAIDGYELESSDLARKSYDAVKMSCKALKLYHVNLLGSLGLLSSLGYGPIDSLGQKASALKLVESRADQELLMRWLLSALLCQSLRTVIKMETDTAENEQQYRFKVMPTQEADVILIDELESDFASFMLPEKLTPEVKAEFSKPEIVETLANASENNSPPGAALHKAHLLTGPNYRLARSLGTYLDISRINFKLKALQQLVGTKLEFLDMSETEEEE